MNDYIENPIVDENSRNLDAKVQIVSHTILLYIDPTLPKYKLNQLLENIIISKTL